MRTKSITAAFVVGLAAAGCGSPIKIGIAEAPEDAQTVIVGIERAGDVSIYGGPVGTFDLPATIDDGDTLVFAFYDQTLEALGVDVDVAPNQITLLPLADNGLPLTPFVAAWQRVFGVDDGWVETEVLPGPFQDVRLKAACFREIGPPLNTIGVGCHLEPEPIEPPVEPSPAVPPEPPSFICENGSEPRDDLGIDVCVPYAPPAPVCMDGLRLSLPDGECVSVVRNPCGQWPDVDDTAIFVDPDAAGPQDGTRNAPYANLVTALGSAVDGDTIALSGGDHVVGQDVAIFRSVRVVGACATDTTVTLAVRLAVEAPEVTIEGITFYGPWLGVGRGAGLTLRDAIVYGTETGIRAYGTTIVENVLLDGRDAPIGPHVFAQGDDANLDLVDVTVQNTIGDAVYYDFDSRGSIRRLSVRRVRTTPNTTNGNGLHVRLGAHVDAEDLLVEDAGSRGVLVVHGASLALKRGSLRDIATTSGVQIGPALEIADTASVTARILTVDRALHSAIAVNDAYADLTELIVRETRRSEHRTYISLFTTAGATVAVDRMHVTSDGTVFSNGGSRLDLANLLYEGGGGDQPDVRGLRAEESHLSVDHAIVRNALGAAASVTGAAGRLSLAHFDVRSLGTHLGSSGVGLAAATNARLSGHQVRIGDTEGRGLYATSTATIDLEDLIVENIRRHAVDEAGTGRAVHGDDGASITLRRALLRDFELTGVASFGSDLTLVDVRIEMQRGTAGVFVYSDVPSDAVIEMRQVLVDVELSNGPPITGPDSAAAIAVYNTSLDAEHITVRNAEPWGIVLNRSPNGMTLKNIDVSRARGTGVYINNAHPRMENLRIASTRADGASRVPAGLYLEAGAFELTGFDAVDNEVSAVWIKGTYDTQPKVTVVENGTFMNNRPVALDIPALDSQKLSVKNIFFRDNARDVWSAER